MFILFGALLYISGDCVESCDITSKSSQKHNMFTICYAVEQ